MTRRRTLHSHPAPSRPRTPALAPGRPPACHPHRHLRGASTLALPFSPSPTPTPGCRRPQFLVARELFRIAYIAERSKRSLPLLRTQQWYFFFTAVFWLYLRCVAAARGGAVGCAGMAAGATELCRPGACARVGGLRGWRRSLKQRVMALL